MPGWFTRNPITDNRFVLQRIFRRKKDASGDTGHRPHSKPFPDGVQCGAGCDQTDGYRCSYRDATGRRCTWWCTDHSVYLNGRNWCQRHANSVKWLKAKDGSIFEILREAAIDDRSPNLVGTLVDEMNDEVSAHLTRCFAHQKGVHIVTDANIRASSMPKGRIENTKDGPIILSEGADPSWDRGWGVYSHVGYLARVLLRVTASEPPIVHLFVNGDRIMSRVPDWITNRGKGGTDGKQDHATFERTVLRAVKDTIIAEDLDR